MRWYLEEYLQFPEDPASTIAARVEARMREIGVDLFRALFQADDARDLWATLRDRLNETRVEVITGVQEAASIPWELIRDPKTDDPLALYAHSFVRAQPQSARKPSLPKPEAGAAIRILLVICRPRRDDDVPFRSVAMRLLEGLNEETSQQYQLDVLRPPTFAQLGRVLRRAKAEGKPYHILHFDGHGVYAEVKELNRLLEFLRGFNPAWLYGARAGAHGY